MSHKRRMDNIAHLHSDIHASCEECHELLGLDLAQKISHYEAKHGYLLLSGYTQTLPGRYGKPRQTKTAVLGHPAKK